MSEKDDHFKKLERMYLLSAPINIEIYNGIQLAVTHERAELSLKIDPRFFHAAHSLHGSVYFKILDDAAFFSVNSIVQDVFVYTVSFHIQILRPVNNGVIRSIGELKFKSKNLFIADSILLDENNKILGRGTGNFMRSQIALSEDIGYK